MDDAFVVRGLEGARDLPQQRKRLVDGYGTTSDALRERLALDELHREEPRPVFLFEAVERRDVRMVQRRE